MKGYGKTSSFEFSPGAKAVIAFVVTLYFFVLATKPEEWSFIDNVNLAIHEAGHTLFGFFPMSVEIVAGSAFQVIVPFLFVLYFFKQRMRYSGSLLLFWVGQSIINISVYAGDAEAMTLPLLGGEGVIHDWNYLLIEAGILHHTKIVAFLIYSGGVGFLIVAAIFSLWFSFPRRRDFILCAGSVVSHEGKILFVEEVVSGGEHLWSLPVVSVQDDESVEEAARRVVFESAGYPGWFFRSAIGGSLKRP